MAFVSATFTIRSLTSRAFLVGALAASATAANAQGPIVKSTASPTADGSSLPAGPSPSDLANSPVAFIHGSVPITRQDLGEFLIARGGGDKLELLVNKKIIEMECQKQKVTVTAQEMEAALLTDLEGLSVKKADFIKVVLPRYGKSLYEWMEDVIKPRLLLTKLCQHRVKIDIEDLKKQFEREFGEKRSVQIIMWPKGDDLKAIQKTYAKIRESQTEFDSAARSMANPELAASAGRIQPISRHLNAEDQIVEKMAFELKPGEISQIMETTQGFMVMKLHAIIPPNTTVKFDDVKARLEKQALDEKLSREIPVCFAELKKAADPRMLYQGPPNWKYDVSPARPIEKVLEGPGSVTPVSGNK